MKEPESQWTAWNRWVSGWIEIAQGLVKVLTLGLVTIAWDLRYVRWVTRKRQG
ncbi:MAG: hypothetical protein JRG72_11160 [Deltaproteobacteria bacterium]|nr:hypothetical protein [Deltaproteobacteria bacterium]